MNPELEDDIWFVPPEERRAVCAKGYRPLVDDMPDMDKPLNKQEV